MTAADEFAAETPWPMPARKDCVFYHSMTYPDGESIEDAWDIRGRFAQYIGDYPIRGKTVLDVGTAGGFLAFEAERAGATVTATDASSAAEFGRVPLAHTLYQDDRRTFVEQTAVWLRMLRNGFWYSWHRNRSRVEVVYAPLARLPYWNRKFDVVIAGAILEHLSDPVDAIANMASVTREALIIAFTDVGSSRRQLMETMNDWSSPSPDHSFTFWKLSKGLYRRVLGNLGFDVAFLPAKARIRGHEFHRWTIVATRKK
jgi:SAM-dependent methyltransferase